MNADEERHPHKNTIAAMQACVDHARDLLDSARAVRAAKHPHIAYHLATLALEEIGRRALIGVQSLSTKQSDPPAWPEKHTQDHVKKLFWCFFGGAFMYERLSGKALEELSGMATAIHSVRLAGLYVDHGDDGLGVPQEAISSEQCDALIELAENHLAIVESEKLRENIPPEEIEMQTWFLKTTEDPEKRRMIFSGASMAKLAELKDAKGWAQWIRSEFEKADAASQAAVEEELRRSRNLPETATKDKWKIRIRILSASHSIRPKAFAKWNKDSEWIKLVFGKKDELIIEFILRDNVPAEALWWFGWGLARHFVAALNIATMGFWWWRMPEQISRYYESMEDLESGAKIAIERSPSLKVDWGPNRVLTEEDLQRVTACFTALPGPHQRDQHRAYDYYIGGLTFLSLNDIHWQCESTAFGNFFQCLKAMMEEAGDWKQGQPFQESLLRFLDEMFPKMDERGKFSELCERFETNKVEGAVVTLKEAAFMKLFCDAYFMRQVKKKRAPKPEIAEGGAQQHPPSDDASSKTANPS